MDFAPIVLAEITSEQIGIDLLLIALLIYSSYYFVKGLLAYLKKTSIQNIPTAKARSAAVGMVELHGKAKPIGEPLVSPFYGFKCLYYAVVVEEEREGKGGKHYTELRKARLESAAPFLLEDETGTITIDPKGASIYIQRDMHRIGPLSAFPKSMREFLDKKSRSEPIVDRLLNFLPPSVMTGRYRVREFTISPGDEIYVFGNAKIPKSQPTYEVSNALVISKGEPWQDFILADHPEEKVKGGLAYLMLIAAIAFINILLCIFSFFFYAQCILFQIVLFAIIIWFLQPYQLSFGKR